MSFRILQRWVIEWKVARGKPVYDPAHPERNTPESFIEANTEAGDERHHKHTDKEDG